VVGRDELRARIAAQRAQAAAGEVPSVRAAEAAPVR
jgi:hypothetical protein